MLYCCVINNKTYNTDEIYHIESDKSPKETFYKLLEYCGKEIQGQFVNCDCCKYLKPQSVKVVFDYSKMGIKVSEPYFRETQVRDEDDNYYTYEDECVEIFIYEVKTINL